MSENTLQGILYILGPLFGTVVGGIIAYFTARGMENTRWRRARREEYLLQKREGLSKALEWIGPMRNAEWTASSLLMTVISGEVEVDCW